jgi:hypothetical protein
MEAEDVESVLRMIGVKRIKQTRDGFIHCNCFFAPYADEHASNYDQKPSMWIGVDGGTSWCECWTCGGNPRAATKQTFVDAVERFNTLAMNRYEEAVKKAIGCEKSTGRRKIRPVYIPLDHTEDYTSRFIKPALPREWLKSKGIEKSSTLEKFKIGVDVKQELVLFPIINRAGIIVGANARSVARETSGGKYFSIYENTQKTHHLFGEHLLDFEVTQNEGGATVAKFQGKGIVVFEGVLDCMHAYEVGLRNCVAIMGSKVSPAQAELLGKWADDKPIALVLDADQAGRTGTKKSIEHVFLDHAPNALVKGFRPTADPKTLTRKQFDELLNGAEAWRNRPVMDLLAELRRAGRGRRKK